MRNTRRSRISLLLMASIMAVAFAGVPTALAQDSIDDPSQAQYEPPIPEGEGTAGSSASGGSGGGSGLDSNIGSLPFTGMDLLIVVGVALLLAGTGFALRRLSAPPGRQT
jgi:hypothetical protein